MESKATARFLMISPRKLRLVADEVRGFPYAEAVDVLRFMHQKGALLLLKLLRSARANAEQLKSSSKSRNENWGEGLYVKKLYVDGGPVLKRWRPRARGRATRILRRTSHATLVLGDDS